MSDSPELQRALAQAADAQQALDRGLADAAREAARVANAVFRRELGDRSPDVANLLVVQAEAERLCGDLDGAQACAGEAVQIMALLPAARSWIASLLTRRRDPPRRTDPPSSAIATSHAR